MNREGVRSLLTELAWDELVRLAMVDRRMVRILLSLLYDADDEVHWLAIEATGLVGGATAAEYPERTRELLRRLLWLLNDESGGSPWGVTGAIGAIVAARPDLFAGHLSMIYPFDEDAAVYPEFLWSLAAVGRKRPELVAEYRPFVVAALGNARADIRGYAAWTAGMLGISAAAAGLADLAGDRADAAVYEGRGVYRRTTVGALAAESLARIQGVD